ncbi:MAG: hypothetical protein QM647_15240 [Asticcacaulis sp.]|uniref:hypothetical protein n=1 Tax=Asticcacaulis sp. TaxID=1872648 RepID=UPI0039E2E2B7
MRIVIVFAMASLAITSVANASDAPYSMLSYTGGRFPVFHNGRKFIVQMHKKYNSLLIQPAFGSGVDDNNANIQDYRAVAEKFVSPVGCAIESVAKDAPVTWEAEYVCPKGVNLQELTKAQKQTLKDGSPLQQQDTPTPVEP